MKIITEKECSRCEKVKMVSEFSKNKRTKSGYCAYCKECVRIYRQEHSEQRKEYRRKYNKEHREQINEREKRYRNSHPDKAKQYRKRQYDNNSQYYIDYATKWNKENPEKRILISRRCYHRHPESHWIRREKEHNLPGNGITNEQWEELKIKYDYRCVYCGSKTKLTLDHVVPVSKNGANDISNAVPACKPCNSSKNKMELKEFLKRLKDKGLLLERTIEIFQELGWSV